MQKTTNQKALSVLMSFLLMLGVFAGVTATVELADVTAFAADTASPGGTASPGVTPEITGISVDPNELGYGGGYVNVTVTGTNLDQAQNIFVYLFDEDDSDYLYPCGGTTVTTTDANTATCTLPIYSINEFDDITYAVTARVTDNDWNTSAWFDPPAYVTVRVKPENAIKIWSYYYGTDGKVGELYANLHTDAPLFENGQIKAPLKTSDVTVKAVAGGAEYSPKYVTIRSHGNDDEYHLNMFFNPKLPEGEYTVTIKDVSGYTFTTPYNNNNFTVLPILDKPVITYGAPNASGEVTVTATVPGYEGDNLNMFYAVNQNYGGDEAGNTVTFTVSPTEPDLYPTKFIYVEAYADDAEYSSSVLRYDFKPAAGDFQVNITARKDYKKITRDGKDYYILATLSAANASGVVTYELDPDYYSSDYYVIIDNMICEQVYTGSGGSGYDRYENGVPQDYDESDIREWFYGDIVCIIGTDAENKKAYANELVNIGYDEPTPNPDGSGSSSSSSSSGSSGGGGGGSVPTIYSPSAPSSNVSSNGSVNQSAVTTELKSALKSAPAGETATVKVRNAASISASTLKALAKEAAGAGKPAVVVADTVGSDGKIQGRLYVDPAKLSGISSDLKLGVNTEGANVNTRKAQFEKFFDNNVSVISFAQKGSFGAALEVAAKVDLSKLNTKTLKFYSYDPATGIYTEIKTEYRIDSNGYIHFTTSLAGDIIITDKPLKKK